MNTKALKKLLCLGLIVIIFFSFCACGKAVQINSVSDLSDKWIAVQRGSSFVDLLKQNETTANAKLIYTSSSSKGLEHLVGNKADAFITDNVVAQYMVNRKSGLTIIDSGLNSSSFGFALKKGDKRIDDFNKALTTLLENGTVDELSEKWFGTDSSQKYVQVQTWEGKNGTLKCLVSPTYEPICYKDSAGNLVGLDMDILVEIAKVLDYKIEFVETSFDNLFLDLKNGKADLVASGITITEERKEFADFTVPYYDSSAVFIVNDLSAASSKSKTISESFYKCFIEEDRWLDLLGGLKITIYSATVSIIFGIILGFIFCILDYNFKAASFILSKLTGLHALLPFSTCLYIGYYIIFSQARIDAFWIGVAVLSLDYGYGAYKNLKGGISGTPDGEIEAAVSMGYKKNQILFKLILPRIMYSFFTGLSGNSKGHIRSTALVGLITVYEVSAVLDVIKAATLEPFLPLVFIASCYAALSHIYSRLFLIIRDCLHLKEKGKDEINDRILRGKL